MAINTTLTPIRIDKALEIEKRILGKLYGIELLTIKLRNSLEDEQTLQNAKQLLGIDD